MIKFTIFFLLIFNVSYAVEFSGDFKQGSFILGKTDPNSKVFIDDREVRVSNDGYFAFGLILSILLMAFAANHTAKLIKKYSWISWVGLFAILIVAIQLIYEDLKILL